MRRLWQADNDNEDPSRGDLQGYDLDGNPVYAARFQASGNLALKPLDNPDPLFCPIRFQGQWADEESGLYYNRFRYYDPLTAQYLSPDPIGILGGLRSQNYIGNPVVYVDPLGLAPKTFDFVGSTLCIVQKFPAGSAAAKELGGFVDLWNNKIKSMGGSMTTQDITDDMEKMQRKWRKDFRKTKCCKGKVAGHVPDTAMGNDPYPPLSEGMAQRSDTNAYLGGIARHAPKGKSYSNVKLVGSLKKC